MIEFRSGDLFQSGAEALVNAVNCIGIMGGGIALAFKHRFPENYNAYVIACDEGLRPGQMFVFDTGSVKPRFIINFPTKDDLAPSQMAYIDRGLVALVETIKKYHIKSIAIPALGCGLGGLDWEEVKSKMVAALQPLTYTYVLLYTP
jgi:O-acetyl-ADP-ribose deacetylase (regulator of RNase III)